MRKFDWNNLDPRFRTCPMTGDDCKGEACMWYVTVHMRDDDESDGKCAVTLAAESLDGISFDGVAINR